MASTDTNAPGTSSATPASLNHPTVVVGLFGWAMLVLVISAAMALMLTIAVTRFHNMYATRDDLGNVAQTLWNSVHGHFYQQTANRVPVQISHLGEHVDLGLLFWAPAFWIFNSPLVLVVGQAIALPLGAVPLYLMARRRLGPVVALAPCILFLAVPSSYFQALFDYHTEVAAIPLLIWAMWALDERRNRTFLILAAALILAKEDLAATVGAMGIYAMLVQRRWRFGLPVLAVSWLWALVALVVVIPHFHHVAGPTQLARYGYLGHGIQIPINMIIHPSIVLHHLATPTNQHFLVQTLRPFVFLPLLGPDWLLVAVPMLATDLLSTDPDTHSIFYQYTAVLTAVYAVATVVALGRLKALVEAWFAPGFNRFLLRLEVGLLALVCAVGWGAMVQRHFGPLPSLLSGTMYIQKYGPSQQALAAMVAMVPAGVPVSATNVAGGYLSDRHVFYMFPAGWQRACYVALDAQDDAGVAPLPAFQAGLRAVSRDPAYSMIYDRSGVFLFRRAGCR